MTDVTITRLPPAPLFALEIWGATHDVAKRFTETMGFALPAMGRSAGNDAIALIRFEPAVWLVEGDTANLDAILKEDGALTAIGGGIVRVALSGPGWRRLLMEGGVFDAENPAFRAGCSAATVIDDVSVRLYVAGDDLCIAYVPASYAHDLVTFWTIAASRME